MVELPEKFIARMQSLENFDDFLKSYTRPAERAIRVNTLKISVDDFKKIYPFSLEEVPWEQNGFYTDGEKLGKNPLHAAGLYYVQEPSAMCVAPRLDADAERVLDLCAAPGGKATQIAQSMKGRGILFLNEVDFSRAKILRSNVERLGVKNAVVCCAPTGKVAGEFEEYFDKILVDAPCSGEGMFKKEAGAIFEWSEEKVLGCAQRQRTILDDAYRALAKDGVLVYSTCTFSYEEDEGQVQNFLKSHPDVDLIDMKKLYPHEVRGEGHFFAVMQKRGGGRRNLKKFEARCAAQKTYREWEQKNLLTRFENLTQIGDTLYSLPADMPSCKVQILSAGVEIGQMQKTFNPSHALAMCLKKSEARCVEANAENYLRGLTFDTTSADGWYLATHSGYPLGWCKVSLGVAKNKLPKGLRIT